MPLIKVSITKSALFQGQTEQFSNVYTFEVPSTAEAAMKTLITAVAEAERPLFDIGVTFVKGYAYVDKTIAGWLNPRVMYGEVTFAMGGTHIAGGGFYRECAFMLKWPLPRKVTDFGSISRQRALRKYLHTCNSLGAGTEALNGSGPLANASRQELSDYAARIEGIADSDLCAPDGARPTGPAIVHPYVEHRQFPRGRKES